MFVRSAAFVGVVLTLATLGAEPLGAQLSTDRPRFGERTSTVPAGSIQVEAGYTYSTFGNTVDIHEVGEVLLRYGLIPGLELRLGIPSFVSVGAPAPGQGTGISDGSLGMKLGLYEAGMSEGIPSLSLLLATGVPLGVGDLPDEYAAGGWEPEAILAFGWSLAPRLDLGANVKFTQRDPGVADRYAEWAASIALGFPVTSRLAAFGEYFAIRPDVDGAADEDYIDGGITFLLSPNLQLDARLGVGVGDTEDAMFFGVGLGTVF